MSREASPLEERILADAPKERDVSGYDRRSRPGYFRLFRNRSFSFLWSGSLASQLGDHLNLMALAALIFAMTEGRIRGFEFSKILLLASVPVLIFGPISGVYADRLSRRKIMIVSDLLRVGLVALIPFVSRSMTPVYLIVFLVFTVNRFYLSAKSAAIPQIVEDNELMAANSLLNVAMMATVVLGPIGGGILVERFGYTVGFMVDASTYLVSAILAGFLTLKTLEEVRAARGLLRGRTVGEAGRPRTREHAGFAEEAARLGREIAVPIEEEVEAIGTAYQGVWADLRDGFARVRGNRLVVYSTISLSAVMFVAGFVLVSSPVIVRNEFGVGTAELGMLFSVGGVGLLIGSLVVGRFFHDAPRRLIISASFILGGVDLLLTSRTETIPGLGVGIFLLGLFVAPAMVTCDTILQEAMPGEAVGKAFGFRDMVSKAAFGLAGILSGIIVDVIGARPLLVLVAIGCAAYGAFSLFLLADTTKLNLLNAYPLMRLGTLLGSALPRRLSRALAVPLADIAYLLFKDKRTLACENIARVAGVAPGSDEAERLARAMFRNYGLYYADFFGLSGRHGAEVASLVRIEGIDHLKRALDLGKGAVFVTGHIGSWDVGGAALASLDGLPRFSAIVEPVEGTTSNSAVTAMREGFGIGVIPIGRPLGVWKALRRNEIVFVLAERLVGAEGVTVDFFGAKTKLPRGAAYIALKSGAPLVPGFCIREADGTYVAYIEPPIEPISEGDFETAVIEGTQRVARVLEKYISRYPDQWCMLQRVWESGG